MSKEKTKQTWLVECMMCETTLELETSEYKIISTDQAAEFIHKPDFICGKCRSVCVVTLQNWKMKERAWVLA